MVERICVWCLVIVAVFMVWGMLKSHQLGGEDASHKRWALFIGKAGSHCVILLYCETLLQVLWGIYCKRIYWIYCCYFTCFDWQSQKCNSKCPNDINTEWAVPVKFQTLKKKIQTGFYFTLENIISLTLPDPFPSLFVFFHYSVVL